jgi:hypothetical protein
VDQKTHSGQQMTLFVNVNPAVIFISEALHPSRQDGTGAGRQGPHLSRFGGTGTFRSRSVGILRRLFLLIQRQSFHLLP